MPASRFIISFLKPHHLLPALALLAIPATPARAQITYLDATEGNGGNTSATGSAPADTSWLLSEGGPVAIPDQWAQREFATGGTIFQALHNGDAIPELTTRIDGLGDGDYEVWVFFWDGPNANRWTISAGLESGSLTTFSFDGPGDTSAPVAASTLTFTNPNAPLLTENPRILYGVRLGETTVSNGSPIEVFIDNLVGGGSSNRTWFDGVGYAPLAPESDDDNDGLPDSFEQGIIASNPDDEVESLADVMGTGASPQVTDFDRDGLDDAAEFALGTDPLRADTDNDGLADGVETGTGQLIDENNTGTDPLNPDSDGDQTPDGAEIVSGTNPNDPDSQLEDHLLAIDFNRSDAFGSPAQSLFRSLSGEQDPANNAPSYRKNFGPLEVTISRPDGENFEFRGANGDSSRVIPGGDLSRSFLVADLIATRAGEIEIEIAGLPAGTYVFRSYHLEPFTGTAMGFAQGSTPTSPNLIEARHGETGVASVRPTSLGPPGWNTTFIGDGQVPTLSLPFNHDGTDPATLSLRATQAASGGERFLFLNGFQLFQITP